jgi:hypothetical protein
VLEDEDGVPPFRFAPVGMTVFCSSVNLTISAAEA